jgi:hypothetical protein
MKNFYILAVISRLGIRKNRYQLVYDGDTLVGVRFFRPEDDKRYKEYLTNKGPGAYKKTP